LPSDNEVLPPEFKKQRGRPLTKRIRKGAWKRKTMHCSNCHGTDHNIRKCRHAPALHGRQQRARDRESSSLSSTSSSSSTSDTSALSDLDSGELQDREWQAEMDRYDELCARADVVRERERQRLQALRDSDAIDIQSDSELSIQASSLFNSMDGIELGQDDGTDSQDLGIAQGIQIETSPWRTRSGKVVKYRVD
jgi:hypothetical protein